MLDDSHDSGLVKKIEVIVTSTYFGANDRVSPLIWDIVEQCFVSEG